ncbi:uncharacterized protein LOC132627173 [Lycium barbarum]|uniref:uncharacterized protein LOC132627173 n=1 Tax=Lycium barbarum TaxID=112863 RepID=UPI00293E0CD2|nr:uncharacterized protein LOC132627173 [Lycium barbarum]XP_060198339.1 uncharacterized protein LOC132627173 [Lycium barbarum]
MEKVGKQELALKKKRERCAFVDQDYIKEGGVAYDGDNSSSSSDDEPDTHYMTFLANAKPDGKSFVVKASDQNGLPVFLKYEKEDGFDDERQYDRELEIRGVEKNQDNVRENYKLGSSKTLKTNARKNRSASIVEKQKTKDGILSKKRGKEDRDLDKRKQRVDVKKEKKTQNGSKFMDAEVRIEPKEDSDGRVEPKEDSDGLEEASPQSEVEILENVDAGGRGSSSNPFVPSVKHSENLEDATIIDSGYRKEVLILLMRPYDDEEYKKLWKDIKMQIPSSDSETNTRGKSLLALHKGVNREIKRTNHDKDKKLNIMRGFFFWLEHLTREDAFMPWEDAECLQTMPGSS